MNKGTVCSTESFFRLPPLGNGQKEEKIEIQKKPYRQKEGNIDRKAEGYIYIDRKAEGQ